MQPNPYRRRVRMIGLVCVGLMVAVPIAVGVLADSFLLAMAALGGFSVLFPTIAGVLAVVAARRERHGLPAPWWAGQR